MELMQASRQWARRPADERFTSLDALVEHTNHQRQISKGMSLANRMISAAPIKDDESRRSLVVMGPGGAATAPTHWSFGQLAARAGAPAGYLRSLPADIAADAINWGLARRDVEDIGVLLRKEPGVGATELAAVTGPQYGRVWNAQIATALRERFGDGVTGDFRVPGEWGRALETVTKDNTTIYASDRDMFVFLADETHRFDVPDRRNGKSGEMSRGFFVWNSEVGSTSFGIATFMFDYVCGNRIVWGAQGFEKLNIRHTKSAPHRLIEEVMPAIHSYANRSVAGIIDGIAQAKQARLNDAEAVADFLQKRFTKAQAVAISAAHLAEESRPIESLWDVTVGVTAYAKGVKYQDERVKLETQAGKIMALAR